MTAPRAPRAGRLAAIVALSVLFVGFLLIGVFPTQDWLAQRSEAADRKEELARVEADNRRLESRIRDLQTPEEIERTAREEYGMVRPGEKPYRMLPPPVDPVELPETWPFTGASDWLNR
jgi:cell division protein FtsB